MLFLRLHVSNIYRTHIEEISKKWEEWILGSNALGAFLLPVIIAHCSFFTGFAFIGCAGLLAGIIALFGPKKTGRNLESMSS